QDLQHASQRVPGAVEQLVPAAVQDGGAPEIECVVDQRIRGDLNIGVRTAQVNDALRAKNRSERLFFLEYKTLGFSGKMLQINLYGAEYDRARGALRDQNNLPRSYTGVEREFDDMQLDFAPASFLDGRRHVAVVNQEAAVRLRHVPGLDSRHRWQGQSSLLVKLIEGIKQMESSQPPLSP